MPEAIDDNQKAIIKDAVQEFVDAQLQGNEPNIEDYVKQYPGLEDHIRQSIKDMQRINTLFDSLVQADESDFKNTTPGQELIAQKVGGFEITEMIGSGGMGVVYLARDTKLKRSVAVKSIPTTLANDSTARMRFRREAELLASLNHPNIAVIYEIIEQDDGTGYLVLEYVPGQTLSEHIAGKSLNLEQVLSIGRQIAEAVSAAHKKGIVHRDLKPGNIKFTPEGRVKVLDFGLAKSFLSEDMNIKITSTEPGRIIGTPAYMSPEQARGKSADYRTDIWSFGCIMFEMLTGRSPYDGRTATDTLARIIEREPDWTLLPKDTPLELQKLIQRCLDKDVDKRLGDIAEASIEISNVLAKPIAAHRLNIPFAWRKLITITGAAIIVLAAGAALWFNQGKQEIRFVVLPFENLGPADDEWFADGITDEITTRLASIHRLGVISRQSAMQYKKSEKNVQQIADELGVDYVLGGTIQRERPSDPNSLVRIRPQLIRASNDMHVWAEAYDGDMSEIFAVQSDIAERVIQALDITLLESEQHALASRPTENIEAYGYYLRGNIYLEQGYEETGLTIAIRMYEKAVELDSRFALAYADLSRVHALMYWYYYDRNEERLLMAKKAVDKSLELDPDLPEAHRALGCYYYWGHLDYNRALKEFTIALKSTPNNALLLAYTAFVYRRQGNIEEAAITLKKALELDPCTAGLTYNLGETFVLLRKYQEAEPYFDRAISLAPDWPLLHAWKMRLYLLWEGNTEKARAVLEQALQNIGSKEDQSILFPWVLLEIFDGNYQEALDKLSSWKLEVFESQFYFIPKAQLYARINGLIGNEQLEHDYYESARNMLESKIEEQPEDDRLHSSLGLVYAGLGRKEDAICEGKLAVDLLPVSNEAYRGAFRVEDLAHIYVMVGEFNAAIDQLEFLLSNPGCISIPLLRLDPTWAPLRSHPRFEKLIAADK